MEEVLQSPAIHSGEATMMERRFKKICKCDKCGNEAEMMITCSLEPEEEEAAKSPEEIKNLERQRTGKTKGHAVCSHCGSEADMWLDM